ncbi:TrmH family RNA methyltransferase [Paenibacillus sp. 1P07SE]|uniref:TrmH family RNA methyltransferase n=1 Tax=Paenibacillus sp. 1P07SE TaxID=3132209 RepID=UPI0039A76252
MAKQEILHITSVQNTRVKGWAALLEKKHRDRTGCFLVEGVHLVQEALARGVELECIVYDVVRGWPEELAPLSEGVEQVAASRQIMSRCTGTDTPPPVFGVARKQQPDRSSLYKPQSLVVVLDGVQDPGNVGTIIRSADAVHADAVVLGRGCVDPYNPKTVRSTMGSLFHLPVIEGDLLELLPEARRHGIRLTGTSVQAEETCYSRDWSAATWLVMGSESRGLSSEVQELLDDTVRIPMRGNSESLNVAMATTVLLYEALRQREYNG